MYPLHRIYPRGVLCLFPYILVDLCVQCVRVCVCACVCPPAGKTRGLSFYIAASCFIGTNLSLVYRTPIPALIGTPINELFNRFLSCVFQIFLRMLFFFYTVRNRSVKYILIVPRYRKISQEKEKKRERNAGCLLLYNFFLDRYGNIIVISSTRIYISVVQHTRVVVRYFLIKFRVSH